MVLPELVVLLPELVVLALQVVLPAQARVPRVQLLLVMAAPRLQVPAALRVHPVVVPVVLLRSLQSRSAATATNRPSLPEDPTSAPVPRSS